MTDDRISKAMAGRYFPFSASEMTTRVESIAFKVQYSGRRPAIWMENCTVECEHGHQLCSFFRERYIASFSLPAIIPPAMARHGVDVALDKFAAIDISPHLSVREQQFVIYRAYLGQLGELTITQHLINGRHRSYRHFDRASQRSKSERDKKGERELVSVTII
jgi:hypothetical protein